MGTSAEAKQARLIDSLRAMQDVVVAYSGGVDSSFLAAIAHEALGNRALAVTAVSPSLAHRELEAARLLASERGWNHRLIGTHEVAREEYARNDPDRCYWCKTELFEVLAPMAHERGSVLLVGTNKDDLSDHRPGLRAAAETGVRSPLAEADLTKEEVRALSRALRLPTAEKPASPCLASRFAYGVRVTAEGLRRIEAAEEALRSLGFEIFRVRDHGELARVEVLPEEIARAASLAPQITQALQDAGFRYVSLDLAGFRSGSLNEVLNPPRIERSR